MNQGIPAGQSVVEASQKPSRASDQVALDWAVALLTLLLVAGLFLDGWAHNNNRVDDTFFTPWHAVLYSSMLATGLFLGLAWVRNIWQGTSWRQALPWGYGLSLLGVTILAGAVGLGLSYLATPPAD